MWLVGLQNSFPGTQWGGIKTYVHQKTCQLIIKAALVLMAIKCSSTDEWMKDLGTVYPHSGV